MRDEQANLLGGEPLRQLADSIDAVGHEISEQLTDVEAEFRPRFRRLERAVEAADEAVRRAERAVECAEDEESREAAEDWLEEARDAADRMRQAMDEIADALGVYRDAAADLERARRNEFRAATSYLHERVRAVEAYAAITLSGGHGIYATKYPGERLATPLPDESQLPSTPLPPGFEWIPISRIAEDQFVDLHQHPPKVVSREIIADGTSTFYEEIVPLLRSNAGIDRETLASLDCDRGTAFDENGLVHPRSLANLADIFLFGSDVLAAELGSDGLYRFQSGRHRATIIRDLGISYLPARLLKGAAA